MVKQIEIFLYGGIKGKLVDAQITANEFAREVKEVHDIRLIPETQEAFGAIEVIWENKQ